MASENTQPSGLVETPKLKPYENYWKEIGLIIVGALIGIVPTIVTLQIQSQKQIRQLILDRQLIALKEYSMAFNQLGSTYLSMVQSIIVKLKIAEKDNTPSSTELEDLIISVMQGLNELQSHTASLNTQRIMIFALFGLNAPTAPLHTFYANTPEVFVRKDSLGRYPEFDYNTNQEIIRAWLDSCLVIEEHIVGFVREGNVEIQELAKRVQQQYNN